MGQTLSEPITSKDTGVVRNSMYRVGSSCMQGWRINMEDSHTHILSLPDDPETAFFGVYDGHGGAKIAEYAGKHLHKYVVNREQFKEGEITDAIKDAFLEFDTVMYDDESLKSEQSGSTAVVVVIKDNKLYCANVGDSRSIACVDGELVQLSYDHKPNNAEEYQRITNAGGWVDCNRVNGNLALSRAFGDYIFKRNFSRPPEQQIVTAVPDIIVKDLTKNWDFLVLACDGIWDVMTNEEVLKFVIEKIANEMEPEEICEELMMRCLAPDCQMAGLGCDNMTVVIVVFLYGQSYEEIVEKCKKYVKEFGTINTTAKDHPHQKMMMKEQTTNLNNDDKNTDVDSLNNAADTDNDHEKMDEEETHDAKEEYDVVHPNNEEKEEKITELNNKNPSSSSSDEAKKCGAIKKCAANATVNKE